MDPLDPGLPDELILDDFDKVSAELYEPEHEVSNVIPIPSALIKPQATVKPLPDPGVRALPIVRPIAGPSAEIQLAALRGQLSSPLGWFQSAPWEKILPLALVAFGVWFFLLRKTD